MQLRDIFGRLSFSPCVMTLITVFQNYMIYKRQGMWKTVYLWNEWKKGNF